MGWRRLGLLVVATWLAAVGFTFDRIAEDAALDRLLPELGAPLMYVAAVLMVVLVVRPATRWAFVLAGPVAVGGLIARPIVVWMNYVVGYTRSGWAVVGAVLIYGALAVWVMWWWIWRVGPWSGRQQVGVGAPGD